MIILDQAPKYRWTKTNGDIANLLTRGLFELWTCFLNWHDLHCNDLSVERLGTKRHKFFKLGWPRHWWEISKEVVDTQAIDGERWYNPPNTDPTPIIYLLCWSWTRTNFLTNKTEKLRERVRLLTKIRLKGQLEQTRHNSKRG